MSKKKLHPKWYITKIYCNKNLILEVGGTKENIEVEIWFENKFISKNLNSLSLNNKKKKFDYNFYIL